MAMIRLTVRGATRGEPGTSRRLITSTVGTPALCQVCTSASTAKEVLEPLVISFPTSLQIISARGQKAGIFEECQHFTVCSLSMAGAPVCSLQFSSVQFTVHNTSKLGTHFIEICTETRKSMLSQSKVHRPPARHLVARCRTSKQ